MTPSTPDRPKTPRIRNGTEESSLTVWLPVELLSALDAHVDRQRERLTDIAPGARITRHSAVTAAIRALVEQP